jgi:hypothetical protein
VGGDDDGFTGTAVGLLDGNLEGERVGSVVATGALVGEIGRLDGSNVGEMVGNFVGLFVRNGDGMAVRVLVGARVGRCVEALDTTGDGAPVGD